MSGVVDSQTEADDQLQYNDVVHRQVPVVYETEEEQVNEDDGEDDHDGDGDGACNEKDHEEDGKDR